MGEGSIILLFIGELTNKCDDNTVLQNSIQLLREKHSYSLSYDKFKNITTLISVYKKLDIIFINIDDLGVHIGADYITLLHQHRLSEKVVLLYKNKDFLMDALHFKFLDYILTPINIDSLSFCLEQIILKKQNKYSLRYKDNFIDILYSDIYFFEWDRHTMYIHTKDQVFKDRKTFSYIFTSGILPNYFFPCTKGIIINLNYAQIKDNNIFILECCYKISKQYFPYIENYIKLYI